MYSRIARAKFRTDKSDDVIRVAKEGVAAHKKLAGFQSVTYLYNRESGWGFSFGLWDTKEHADAAMEGMRGIVESFGPYRVNPGPAGDTVEGPLPSFEVVAQG